MSVCVQRCVGVDLLACQCVILNVDRWVGASLRVMMRWSRLVGVSVYVDWWMGANGASKKVMCIQG